MDLQDAFDTAARGIIGQGGPSYDTTELLCMYRGPDARKCALGWLIPDSRYRPSMEFSTRFEVLREAGIDVPEEFARDLQDAHDIAASSSNFFERWASKMRDLASVYSLNTDVLKDIP